MTRFRDVQHAIFVAPVWVDDDKIKSDCNFKKKTWELRLRGETERWDVRHQWRRENQDQHKAHETRHLTSECARSLLVSSCCRHTQSLYTTSRGSSPRVCNACSERHSSTLSSPFHPTSYSAYAPSISSSSCCPSTSTRISGNIVFSANTEMGSTDESNSLTYGEVKTVKRNVLLIPHLCLYSQKISSRTLVIPRTWIRNKVVFHLQWKTWRRMGQSRWIDDDQIRRKRTPSFPSHESVVSRNTQKAKEVDNWYTSVPMRIRWRLFFAQSFL